jgi:hypothetical protein
MWQELQGNANRMGYLFSTAASGEKVSLLSGRMTLVWRLLMSDLRLPIFDSQRF